ncbi:unnamed protein product [Tilletia laevis]|uniref:Uncharacterized protein n=2 Tax=Tilletia TaxID=13289 RepID=A0A9N8M5Q8_9BASI|nr:hypothetical protein CF335_g8711 [Tilletia laevis]KAE8241924.1 hypothetical protein A4X03_0g8062 [Tilletia caries]CAD6898996.1 unnamed protein product [Tilletia controversa]KAE8186136.1 hypothetical protein CF336_g7115 [Tilletia laevis]CAD6925783.1 unnamed protein product [Tilletia caries]
MTFHTPADALKHITFAWSVPEAAHLVISLGGLTSGMGTNRRLDADLLLVLPVSTASSRTSPSLDPSLTPPVRHQLRRAHRQHRNALQAQSGPPARPASLQRARVCASFSKRRVDLPQPQPQPPLKRTKRLAPLALSTNSFDAEGHGHLDTSEDDGFVYLEEIGPQEQFIHNHSQALSSHYWPSDRPR